MENNGKNAVRVLGTVLSYLLVAVIAVALTLLICQRRGTSKLDQLEALLAEKYIGQFDQTAVEDSAAEGMIAGLGDRWSYYISAADYAAYTQDKDNTYVGVGITVQKREDGTGYDILSVTAGTSAQKEGILPGDILTQVDGKSTAELPISEVTALVRGKEGTRVVLTVLRQGAEQSFTLTRRTLSVTVAEGAMLDGGIGLVTISNFNNNCAKKTKAVIEELIGQGATALIFDVRNNPGGYKDELVKLLDYLLPAGPLFRSVDYRGDEEVSYSDEACVELPMAVLMNADSYSAAEFFAAALSEYGRAKTVGAQTCGKSYYQQTTRLKDGSAVALSVGKYFTPNGVCLAEVGGLVPDIPVETDEETEQMIAAKLLTPQEDPQIRAAAEALAAQMP